MLRRAGYGVDNACNGAEGVKMAGQWRYDLIVMDMSMPDMSGAQATQLIRMADRAAGFRRVPVIAFTANYGGNDGLADIRQKAIRAEMDDFLTKPIERKQLLAAVKRSLDDKTVVLVANDSVADRERTMRYLRAMQGSGTGVHSGVGTLAAGTGAEAYFACTRQRVSLAMVNVCLPDMSGIELIHQIRPSKNGESIGIVAVSDTVDPEARKRLLASGCGGFIEKPYGQKELRELVQPLLTPAEPEAVAVESSSAA